MKGKTHAGRLEERLAYSRCGPDDSRTVVSFERDRSNEPSGRLFVIKRAAYGRWAGPVLDPSDSVILLLDHQSGLFQTVKDISVTELRANTIMLAKLATLLKMPVITTASEPNGPNGPLMPEIHQFAPDAVYVPRKGEVNAWDNEDFVKTVRTTGRKTLIMAGVWTSVCVMFPALDANAAGFKVYAVMDASGDPSEMASRTTLARFVQGGVIPTTTNAVLSETHRTWNRPEAAELAKLYALVAPNYAAVMESYQKAQDVARQSK
jgi:nicotinamidase-related amidase